MKTVKRWTLPRDYFGATWDNWFSSGFGRSRDSDALEESNFQVAYDRLKQTAKDVPDHESGKHGREGVTVQIVSENHWAVGWVEWIAIHESDTESLAVARELCESYNQYPALDEDHWSNLEYTRAMEFWDSMSLSAKVDYCRDCDVSIFAARRSHDLPDRLYESLTRP